LSRNQSFFTIELDGKKDLQLETWSISGSEDAAASVEVTFDALRYPEAAALASKSIESKEEPLQFRGNLTMPTANRQRKIKYNLVLVGVKWPYKQQITLSCIVKQFTFDRPLALRSAQEINDSLGGNLTGDLGEIIGTVVKPGLIKRQLPGKKVVQRPDGSLLVIGQNNGQEVVVRNLPVPGDCIKYELGIRQGQEKQVASQVEVNNANPLVNAVTGSSGSPVAKAKDSSTPANVAKILYAHCRAAGLSDLEARAIVAYHCTECGSYQDWNKIQNGGLSSGIFQWTQNGCEQITNFKGNTNAEKYAFLKANINNADLQCSALLEYRRIWTARGSVKYYKAQVQRQLASVLSNDPLKIEYMAWAGVALYPGSVVTVPSGQGVFDRRVGSNNPTLREMVTGKYKLEHGIREMQRLLS
jgi:hypothetical protein